MQPRIQYHATAIAKAWCLNLDELLPHLRILYPNVGRPAQYQPEILRSLVLMVHYRVFSITHWVKILRSDEICAIACGFDPNDVPGVGTFCDFLNRFYPTPKRQPRPRKPIIKPHQKLRADEKQPPKHPDIIRKLVKRLMGGRKFHNRPEKLLNKILAYSVVLPSAQKGLLGDPTNLAIAGDGALYESGGSPYGIKSCNCKQRCSCPRRYSDPEANWGWDSYRDRWVYGYSVYELTAADSPNDLPILMATAQASRHDSVMALRSLSEAKDLYPQFSFSRFLADSAHDSYPFYQLLDEWQMQPFIDLNPRNSGKLQAHDPIQINHQGTPICPGGFPMVLWGYCRDRQRIKWRCPQACGKVTDCQINCSPSNYGRVIYTYTKKNLRLLTKTARSTEAWKKVYARRTTVERSIKRKKFDYSLENTRARSKKKLLWLSILAGINQHLDAWLAQSDVTLGDIGIHQAA